MSWLWKQDPNAGFPVQRTGHLFRVNKMTTSTKILCECFSFRALAPRFHAVTSPVFVVNFFSLRCLSTKCSLSSACFRNTLENKHKLPLRHVIHSTRTLSHTSWGLTVFSQRSNVDWSSAPLLRSSSDEADQQQVSVINFQVWLA